jgi:TRAP-type C4-dicarboxylate transport system substrate-binding protein
MKFGRKLTLIFSGLLATLLLSSVSEAGNVKWNLSSVFPPGNFHVKNIRTFAEEAKKVTGGELEITVHDSAALGIKGPATLGAVRDRIVDAAESSLEWQVGEVRMAALGAMPGLALGYDETFVLADTMRPHLNKALAKHNQKLLYMVPWQGQGLYANIAINTKADIKGLKMRAASEMALRFFEEMGASPIQLPWSEVVPALASRLINGVSTSSSSGVDGKFWEFMGYHSRYDWSNPISVVVVNLDAWKELSPGSRAAVEKLTWELEPQFWSISKGINDDNLVKLSKNGMKVTTPNAALQKEILEAGKRVLQKYLETAGPDAKAIVKEYNARMGR